MKCRTCARRLDLEKLDYTVGCKHEQMEGFICLACAFEGVAYWMTNVSDEDSYCEEYVPQRTPNAFPTHSCVGLTHSCVEKQVTGKLINVEIPTKRESEEAEKQVNGDLISRQAVLDFVGSMEMTDQISADAYKELTIYLEGLPSEPVGNSDTLEWIPCSDRLPSEKGEYLVTYHPCYWDRVEPEVKVGIDTFRGKTSWAKKKYQKVIAWKPKPMPWEGEEDD